MKFNLILFKLASENNKITKNFWKFSKEIAGFGGCYQSVSLTWLNFWKIFGKTWSNCSQSFEKIAEFSLPNNNRKFSSKNCNFLIDFFGEFLKHCQRPEAPLPCHLAPAGIAWWSLISRALFLISTGWGCFNLSKNLDSLRVELPSFHNLPRFRKMLSAYHIRVGPYNFLIWQRLYIELPNRILF